MSNSSVGQFHMSCEVDQEKKKVVFLYKLKQGPCLKSYGMNVAEMAKVPKQVPFFNFNFLSFSFFFFLVLSFFIHSFQFQFQF